ncbi:DNA primase, partial [[Clostridium] symbiosum]
ALLRITGECEEAGDFAASLRKSPRLTPDPQTCADNIKDGIITRWDLSIQEDDFQAVLSLAEPMYLHAVHILSFLP